jgi:predicted nucleotidyltransferase
MSALLDARIISPIDTTDVVFRLPVVNDAVPAASERQLIAGLDRAPLRAYYVSMRTLAVLYADEESNLYSAEHYATRRATYLMIEQAAAARFDGWDIARDCYADVMREVDASLITARSAWSD